MRPKRPNVTHPAGETSPQKVSGSIISSQSPTEATARSLVNPGGSWDPPPKAEISKGYLAATQTVSLTLDELTVGTRSLYLGANRGWYPDTLLGRTLNLGGFGLGEVALSIQSPDNLKRFLSLMVLLQVTQLLLLNKKKQYERLYL